MKFVWPIMATALLAGCQAQQDATAPSAPAANDQAATTAPAESPAAIDIAAISGAWAPYSTGADTEFGNLDISADRAVFSRLGTATVAMQGRFAVLTWTAIQPEARNICGEEPPPLVEFRVTPKATILAEGTPGDFIELSFYRRVEAMGADRETTTDLCRIATWER